MMIWKWAIKLFDKSLKSDNMLAVQEQVFLIQKKYNCVMNLSYNLSCGLSEVSAVNFVAPVEIFFRKETQICIFRSF